MAANVQAIVELIAPTAFTHTAATLSGLTIGGDKDIKTSLYAGIYIYHAAVETVTPLGTDYKIQLRWSTGATQDEDWATVYTFTTGLTAAVAAEIAGTEAAGTTQIVVDADPTAAFTRGIKCYAQDTTTVADSEWAEVDFSVAVTDVNLVDGLTVGKDAADTLWTQAETNYTTIDLGGASFIRCIVQHTGATGPNLEFKVEMVEVTAFT